MDISLLFILAGCCCTYIILYAQKAHKGTKYYMP